MCVSEWVCGVYVVGVVLVFVCVTWAHPVPLDLSPSAPASLTSLVCGLGRLESWDSFRDMGDLWRARFRKASRSTANQPENQFRWRQRPLMLHPSVQSGPAVLLKVIALKLHFNRHLITHVRVLFSCEYNSQRHPRLAVVRPASSTQTCWTYWNAETLPWSVDPCQSNVAVLR